jgi:hypothetical protein
MYFSRVYRTTPFEVLGDLAARCITGFIVLGVSPALSAPALAFQIGALGPKLESRLTKEPEPALLRAASRLGRLLKMPVHEEITQIGFDCPVDLSTIADDMACSSSDAGFAEAFVIYGVRWNDLPPFRLSLGQGSRCKKFGFLDAPACNPDQTVRFSTQPDCWLCLFKEAKSVARTKTISGCARGEEFVQGTLMTRSHFGDLQFLHAMANAEGVPPQITRSKVLDWAQFGWRVFDGDFGPDTALKTIDIPTIQEHFGCTDWTVSDIYVLGNKDVMNRRLPDIAFGSVVHMVQDSFAQGHVEREPARLSETCATDTLIPGFGGIVEFHAYGQQDGGKHDARDAREAMIEVATSTADVVQATRHLFTYWNQNANWKRVEPYFQCVFSLSESSRPSTAGADFVQDAW